MKLSCSEFFTAFFHNNRLTNDCFSERCKKTLHGSQFNRTQANIIKVLACLPIVGQVLSLIFLWQGYEALKFTDPRRKVAGVAGILRGVLTFFGLGIVCLLVDIIITLAIFIKNKLY